MYLISYKNNRNKIALTGIGAIFILKKKTIANLQKVKNSSLLSKFLNNKKSRIHCKSGNSLRSDTPAFARLILFDFLSKISIRNSLIFYFRFEILIFAIVP